MDAVTLKPATGHDLAFACRVAEEAMREYAVATFGKWDHAEVRRRNEENIRSGILRIIEREGTPIGIHVVEREKDHIALNQIFLLPEHQGGGIGSELVKRLMEESRASGLPLRLRVLRVNPAQRFYLRLGFRVVRMTDERYFMEYSEAATRRATLGIQPCEIPEASLLRKYQGSEGYADCYVVEVAGSVTLAAFVEAFYTTALFKVERAILGLASMPSNDSQARQLANGSIAAFAAWRVEGRNADQLLLADVMGRTKSWLMAAPIEGSADARSNLYFGSAVVPKVDRKTGERKMGLAFGALLGFHKMYSRMLLASARSRLLAGR